MYAALNKAGQLYYATDVTEEMTGTEWYCPRCHRRMIFAKSSKGKPFFKHLPRDTSSVGGESQTHRLAKEQLVGCFTRHGIEVKSEYDIDGSDRIADLLLPDYRLVIEIQHTPIAGATLRSRTLAYHKVGYDCLWLMTNIVDDLSGGQQWPQTLLQYHAQLGYYRVLYDTNDAQIRIQWAFSLVNYGNMTFQEYRGSPAILLAFEAEKVAKASKTVVKCLEKSRSNPQQQLLALKKNQHYQNVIRKLYTNGILLDDLPKWFFSEHIVIVGIKTASWIVLAWLWKLTQETTMTFNETLDYLVTTEKIQRLDQPFVNKARWLDNLSAELKKLFAYFASME